MTDIVEWLRNSNSDEWCSGQLLKAADEITRLRAEAAIRIDAFTREQEAHLRTITDYNRARVENEKLLNANLSLRNKYLRLQHKLGRIAKVLDEPTVAAASIGDIGE